MMVSGPNLNTMQISQEDLSEERYSDEEESYSDEIDEFSIEMHPRVPQTFEDFDKLYRAEASENLKENLTEKESSPPVEIESPPKPSPDANLDASQESPIPFSQEPEDVDYYPDSEEEIDEETEEEQEISGRKIWAFKLMSRSPLWVEIVCNIFMIFFIAHVAKSTVVKLYISL